MAQGNVAARHKSGADVIVVGWKEGTCLVPCVESLLSAVPAGLADFFVVLNQPAPTLEQELRSHFGSRMGLWSFRSNLGFGGAVNFAARRGNRKNLVLVNDDSTVEAGWLEALLDAAQRHPKAGAIGSTFLNADGTLQEAGSILWSSAGTFPVGRGEPLDGWCFERRVDYCSGGSLLVRRSVWESVGGIDERYYPAYHEDVDLCLRLAEDGWETWYQPLSRVRHVRGASTTARFRQFVGQRNGERFIERWSDLLATREPPGTVEAAIWKAMGCPYRVLVLAGPEPAARVEDVLRSLVPAPDLHVAVHGRGARGMGLPLSTWGVRAVDDLAGHLQTPGVCYGVVIDVREQTDDGSSGLIDRWLPDARRMSVPTLSGGGTPKWAELIRMASQHEDEL